MITSSKNDLCKKKNVALDFGKMNSVETKTAAVLAFQGSTVSSCATRSSSRLGKRIPHKAQKI